MVIDYSYLEGNVAEEFLGVGQAGRGELLERVQSAAAEGRGAVRAEAGEDGRTFRQIERERPERDPHLGLDRARQRDRIQGGLPRRGQQVPLEGSIVMEFAANGDLSTKIAHQQQQPLGFNEKLIWQLFIQTLKGLKQLHDLKILHRDIKTANVFLGANDEAKLGDMNVSKIAQDGLCITQTGTPYYASPEVWKDLPYDEKSDIWSLGCVLYELTCLKVPFKGEDMEALYKKVTRGIYSRLPSEYSAELGSVIRALLQVNPDRRPSCDKILKMACIQKRMESEQSHLKGQLLKTIRGDNFQTIGEQLPKPNYLSKRKHKIQKTLAESDEKYQIEGMGELQSLPILDKDRKLFPAQNSDRVMSRDKLNIQLGSRDRKKSEMGYSRSGLETHQLYSKLEEIKELKLPKVPSRYARKDKGPKHNQNSIRVYKVYES